MAVTPRNDPAFLREVDEELRREQLNTYWRRYGRLTVIGVAVLLIAFAAMLWWRHAQEQKRGLAGEKFTQALLDLGQNKTAPATATLNDLTGGGNKGYAAVAKLTLADAALTRKDDKAAAAQFGAIAADASVPQPFRDLALIRQTAVQLDTLPPATVVARLKPLAEAGGPWFGSAGEMVALSYLKMGKPELAGPLFGAVAKDNGVPNSIRGRAARMAGALGVDVVAQPQGAAAGE